MATRDAPGWTFATGCPGAKVDNPSVRFCHADTIFLTQLKLLGVYTVPRATPGQIEMWIGNDKDKIEKTTGSQGKVWCLPKSEDHALFNRGSADVEHDRREFEVGLFDTRFRDGRVRYMQKRQGGLGKDADDSLMRRREALW
jgi:hypothetical protein